jgi:hypothetical protein
VRCRVRWIDVFGLRRRLDIFVPAGLFQLGSAFMVVSSDLFHRGSVFRRACSFFNVTAALYSEINCGAKLCCHFVICHHEMKQLVSLASTSQPIHKEDIATLS